MTAKADSGVSNHYWQPQDVTSLNNIKSDPFGPCVKLPDNSLIRATQTGQVNLHTNQLSTKAQSASILPHLKNASLISIGQLTDDNCITVLDQDEINIYKKENSTTGAENYHHNIKLHNKIITGPRNCTDGLWDLQILTHQPTQQLSIQRRSAQINAIVQKSQTKTELASYLHASAEFPAVSTFTKAIQNGNFIT